MGKFNLQTGTLNHHLKMLKDLLDQDEAERYILNRDGHFAYGLLSYAATSLSKPTLPMLRRGVLISSLKSAASGFYNLIFQPTRAFTEAQERSGAYAICGSIVIVAYIASILALNMNALIIPAVEPLLWLIFSYSFARIAYGKHPRPSRLATSVGVAYFPAFLLNAFSLSLAAFQLALTPITPLLLIENLSYATFMEFFSAIILWRFFLLLFAIRESCKTTTKQALAIVLLTAVTENVFALAANYLLGIPMELV